jgi:uncharacterized protein YjiS (DUF1127 family)
MTPITVKRSDAPAEGARDASRVNSAECDIALSRADA